MKQKFIYDVLSEIRAEKLNTPIDNINLLTAVFHGTDYELIEIVHSIRYSPLSSFLQNRLDRVCKILGIESCKLGYCVKSGLYDQYKETITHRCPKCGHSLYQEV